MLYLVFELRWLIGIAAILGLFTGLLARWAQKVKS